MYCDHKNLIHNFAPDKEWPKHTRGKLMRWAAIIGGYRYTIEHIDGIHNGHDEPMGSAGYRPGDPEGSCGAVDEETYANATHAAAKHSTTAR